MPSNGLKLLVLGAIGALAVIVIALGVVFVTMRQPSTPAAGGQVAINVSDTACTPNALNVAAGTPDFSIKNTSNRAIEWEILNGVMVVAERENIAPGFTVEVTPRLEPGRYEMTCGLLDNPHGTLTVVAVQDAGASAPAPPRLADLVGPTAEFRVYVIQSADALTTATATLSAAVKSGDLATARAKFAEATADYAHLAPIAHLFQRDADPLSTGPTSLPRLGQLLAGSGSDGLASTADAAARSAASLGGTVNSTTASPHEIVAGAGAVVAGLAGAPAGDEAAARITGVRKVVELFRPLTLRADQALAAKLDRDLATVEAALAKPAPDSAALKPQLADLGADLVDMQSALGLNAT